MVLNVQAETNNIKLYMNPEVISQFKKICYIQGATLSEIGEQLIQAYIAKHINYLSIYEEMQRRKAK